MTVGRNESWLERVDRLGARIGSQRTGGGDGGYNVPMGETCDVLDAGAGLLTALHGEHVMKFDCGALRSRQYTFVPRTQLGFMMKSSLN
jgi:hypothetical protein